MNSRQRFVIVLGFVVIFGMGLYPPWTTTYMFYGPSVRFPSPEGKGVVLTPAYAISHEYGVGHKWLPHYTRWWKLGRPRWVEKTGSEAEHYYQVDTSLLLIHWFLVSAVTGIIAMFLGDRRKSPADKPDE